MFHSQSNKRRIVFLLAIFFAFLGGFPVISFAESMQRFFIGTYTGGDGGSKGIYTCLLDAENGQLTEPVLVAECENPSFFAIHPTKPRLYAVGNKGRAGMLFAFQYDPTSGKLNSLNEKEIPGRDPCHLALCISEDGKNEAVVVANYSSASVVSFPLLEDGRIGEIASDIKHEGSGPNVSRQKEPHPHGAYFNLSDRKTVAVPDLGIDRVVYFDIDLKTGKLTPKTTVPKFLEISPGAGPRHLAASDRFVYVNNELASTVCVFDLKNKEPGKMIQEISTLPEDADKSKNSTAEIELSNDGNFLYVSNRGHESIAVFSVDKTTGKLSSVQHAPCGGIRPRFFCLNPEGNILISCNKNSGDMTLHRVDEQTGKLTLLPGKTPISRPVCIVFVP